MGKRKQTHLSSDQFGEVFSQDKDERQQSFASGKGGAGTGGGTAGSTSTAPVIAYERHVPKFLQPFAHMLGKGKGRRKHEDDPEVDNQPESVEDEEELEAEAIQRALADNPTLAAEVGDKFAKQVEAQVEKELGNKAFAKKDYTTAISHFNRCIELEPENEVYYSNRSAAHVGLNDFESALEDARKVRVLKPGWVKGWARLATAHFGLKQYSDAKDAYERALEHEPDDQALQKGFEKAQLLELQQIKEHKHVFKKMKLGHTRDSRPSGPSGRSGPSTTSGGKDGGSSKDKKASGSKVLLSFGDDE